MGVNPEELTKALSAALAASGLDIGPAPTPAEFPLERPKNREHGDYATSIALQMAKAVGKNPGELAALLAPIFSAISGIEKVDIAGPGFLNITLAQGAQVAIVREVLAQGANYGKASALAGMRINLEFISANPTGPLHLGHTRWAAVGDSIARVLSAAGAEVTREFYINDRGTQMELFAASLHAAAHGFPTPENGYHGAYIEDLAREIVTEDPKIMDRSGDDALNAFREAGYRLQLAQQKKVLKSFDTHFDVWYSEKSLHDSGAVATVAQRLEEKGHIFHAEGATWLRTTDFGDDKDRVLVKADGELTYFTSDTAYYLDKRARGFENGEEVKLSKRAGTIITLEELVEKVGVDAARYTLSRYPTDTPLTLDVDLMKKHSNDNPVYYVQYAHARINALLRNAAELGVSLDVEDFQEELLNHERENELAGALAQFPQVVLTAAQVRGPHKIARYLEEIAGLYHRFYNDCRVLPMGDEKPTALHTSRALLCTATKQLLANGLALLGVSAPERM
ncbi:MAG: arginine--tRNA ligase [Actinobacteria bacterium]|uniref:Arginine--tRNA ligase n=1 Tax=Candidatus Fonsibacter lacus TaxID=2576439 RepID=A0A965GCE6_9PROT|nr:arginine--tRNA ligase [Candidatus Fonsibacter lacus]